jgi:hypothetical protein
LGRTYEPGDLANETLAAPTIFSEQPIAADLQHTLEWHDQQKSTAGILVTQTLDTASSASLVREFMSYIAPPSGKQQPQLRNPPADLEVRDTGRYTVDLTSGWITEAKHERKATAEGHAQIDTLEFKRVQKPTR